MYRRLHGQLLTASLLILTFVVTGLSASSTRRISGTVTGSDNRPIWAATAVLRQNGKTFAATPTDSLGHFTFTLADSISANTLTVSAVGYQSRQIALTDISAAKPLIITLTEALVELEGMRVNASRDRALNNAEISSEQIRHASSNSLVPGNPTAALATPQLTRIGSNHSSQIRVSGSAPIYYLNGSPIGSDPNHFGAFSVVPGAIVRTMRFLPQGTDVSYATPSAVNFSTLSPYNTKLSGSLNLSTIETDALFKVGNSKFFALGSLRKSTLDKLVSQFDISANRRTIPPTNFQDIFASAGVRLSPIYHVQVDQYFVRDFLSFNTASAGSDIPSTQTLQAARESFTGLKLHRTTAKLHLQASAAFKSSVRQYVAEPQGEVTLGDSRIVLTDSSNTVQGRLQSDLDFGHTRTTAGIELESDTRDQVHLHQTNWNLQPPFACTDNPFIYQFALNETFGHYSGDNRQNRLAGFLSLGRDIGRITVESGLRYERISPLINGAALLQRHQLTLHPSDNSAVRLHYGEYIENPVTAILEPNQALIRAHSTELSPIRTRLVTADYSLGPLQFGIFRKWITNTPIVSPNYSQVYSENSVLNPEFLGMSSSGRADFRGLSVDLSLDKFLVVPLSMHSSYALSEATRTEHGITYPHELDSRHRLLTQLDYRASSKVSLGMQIQIRTGYPYSPLRKMSLYYEPRTYNETYLKSVLSQENSRRFPVNATLNIHARFDFDRTEMSLALTNVTNRYNPLISSASGLIYDAGILPSFGLTWKF